MIVTSSDILDILDRVKALGYRRFRLEHDGLTLEIDEESNDPDLAQPSGATASFAPAGGRAPAPTPAQSAAPPLAAAATEQLPASNLVAITAPMAGMFYRTSSPGSAPFVEIGSHVQPRDIVCIIEVMKLFASVQAGVAGTVREIAVGNEQPVLAAQVVMLIEPDPQ